MTKTRHNISRRPATARAKPLRYWGLILVMSILVAPLAVRYAHKKLGGRRTTATEGDSGSGDRAANSVAEPKYVRADDAGAQAEGAEAQDRNVTRLAVQKLVAPGVAAQLFVDLQSTIAAHGAKSPEAQAAAAAILARSDLKAAKAVITDYAKRAAARRDATTSDPRTAALKPKYAPYEQAKPAADAAEKARRLSEKAAAQAKAAAAVRHDQ